MFLLEQYKIRKKQQRIKKIGDQTEGLKKTKIIARRKMNDKNIDHTLFQKNKKQSATSTKKMINKNTITINEDKSTVPWTKVFLLHKIVDKSVYKYNLANIK